MEQQTLKVETRQLTGKGPARRLRSSGKLPGVLYGLGHHVNIAVDPLTIRKHLLEEGGRNKVFTLDGGEVSGRYALIKDWQIDPLSRVLVHVDLLEIDVTKKIQATVPLNFTGKSVGVAEGGVLNIIERTVEIKCLPHTIPKHIDVDVTSLKIGDSIHLETVALPEGVEKALHTNPTLVTVVPPTKEEEAAPSLAPTAEPEVITEKKTEEGAAGAGAATAAGDAKKEDKDKKK
jgi:large subunit ribosomal protein L25